MARIGVRWRCRGRCGRYLFVLALCAMAWTRPVRAQSASTIAEALFEQGRDAMRASDYATACARFRESNRLDPAVGTLFNLASCEEQRGALATAWELYRATLEQLPNGDARAEIARTHLTALEPRLPRVTIHLASGAPASTVVTRGTLELQGAALGVPLPLDPGKQELHVRAPGYAERGYELELREGQAVELVVAPGTALSADAASVAPAPPSRDAAPASDAPTAARGRRTAGYIVGGVGVAALLTGALTGALALHDKSESDAHCSDALRLCDAQGKRAAEQGRTLGTISGATLIGGGVALAVGGYLVLSGPATPAHAARARLFVAGLADGAALAAEGSW